MTSTVSQVLAALPGGAGAPAHAAHDVQRAGAQPGASPGAGRPLEVFSADMEARVHELVVGHRRHGLPDLAATRPARPTSTGADHR